MDVHVIHWANAMPYPRGGNLVIQTSVKQKHESRISCNCNHFAFQGVFHGIENFLSSGRPINYKLPETSNIYVKTPGHCYGQEKYPVNSRAQSLNLSLEALVLPDVNF